MKKRIKIVTVCSMGLGTSILAQISIEKIVKGTDYQVVIETADVGSATGYAGDIFITTKELIKAFTPPMGTRLVLVSNFFDVEEMRRELLPVLEELS